MFGVLVIGAPGAGKSTLCAGLSDAFTQLKRNHLMINLDPANDITPYECHCDVRELITVEEVMDRLQLGPNGALRYSISTLARNKEWLLNKFIENKDKYAIIDCPGQLEIYKSDGEFCELVRFLQKSGVRLCAVHLSDSMFCSDAPKFISVVMSTLSVMVQLEMPQINVLSKVDLLTTDIPFDLEFFTQLPDISRLLEMLNDVPELEKYRSLNEAICQVIGDYDLVSFVPLNVESKEDMAKVIVMMDKANGFAFCDRGDIREMVIEPVVDQK
ncbi:unnamed protein product, partial [Mesorhabditis belari]|uniref:GPN-loop GTPase 2 n=1 Tax=Mesorhabditis belari TaxID=2138241 RepID=A0AAF3F682_9BILA